MSTSEIHSLKMQGCQWCFPFSVVARNCCLWRMRQSVHYSLENCPVLNKTSGAMRFKMHILNKDFTPQAWSDSILLLVLPTGKLLICLQTTILNLWLRQFTEKTKTLSSFRLQARLRIQASSWYMAAFMALAAWSFDVHKNDVKIQNCGPDG